MLETAGVDAVRGGTRPFGAIVDGRARRQTDGAARGAETGPGADRQAQGDALQNEQIGDEQRRRRLSILPSFVDLLGHDPTKIGGSAPAVNGATRRSRAALASAEAPSTRDATLRHGAKTRIAEGARLFYS
jgi:hypothetical protein